MGERDEERKRERRRRDALAAGHGPGYHPDVRAEVTEARGVADAATLPPGAMTYAYEAYLESVSGDELNGGTTYEDVQRAVEAAAPLIAAAATSRLREAIEAAALNDAADTLERIDGDGRPAAWLEGIEDVTAWLRARAALASPVSDDTGGTK